MLTLQSVNAQRKEGKTRTPEQMVEKLDKKLNLTDEQEKQITTLYSDFFKQDLSREERKSAMQELEKKITSNPQLSSSASFLRLNVLSSLN